tara:strand:+ start:1999 stop:2262 length:264 start_codon:yes stop_codon:yes gene_type:complete
MSTLYVDKIVTTVTTETGIPTLSSTTGIDISAEAGNITTITITGGLVLPRLTTDQRNNISVVDGMVIYNTTTNKFQGIANGVWVNLH